VEHKDPLHSGLASHSIDHLFLALHREQFELQHTHARGDLVRDWQLFIADEPLPTLSREFFQQYGLTVEDWLRLSFVSWVAAQRDPRCCFTKETVIAFEGLNIPPRRADCFFNASSKTPADIGQRFEKMRAQLKPQFHSLIRSSS